MLSFKSGYTSSSLSMFLNPIICRCTTAKVSVVSAEGRQCLRRVGRTLPPNPHQANYRRWIDFFNLLTNFIILSYFNRYHVLLGMVNFIQKSYPYKKLSTNKSRKKNYPEVLNFFIQNVCDLFFLIIEI